MKCMLKPKLQAKLLTHAKESYLFQLEQRDKLGSRIALALTGLGIVANLGVTYLNSVPAGLTLIGSIYLVLLGIAACTWGIATCYFLSVLGFPHPNKYQVLPSPRKVNSEIEELANLMPAVTDGEHAKLEEALDRRLTALYADAAALNESENERRKDLVRKNVFWLVISLIFLLADAPLFFYIKHGMQLPLYSVEIVKPVTVNQ
jgi:hypothetical protein